MQQRSLFVCGLTTKLQDVQTVSLNSAQVIQKNFFFGLF